jgi:hypothetical protein
MSDDDFVRYLLQIGFIARDFVKWYEIAKQGVSDERAKEVVRNILRDEIPSQGPTHQDERLYDLAMMGVRRSRVLRTRPTKATREAVKRLYYLVRDGQDYQDLRIMVTLRVAGEVLVAEQYGHIVSEMHRRFTNTVGKSRFYEPHYRHDMKGSAEREDSAGHTDAFDALLSSMIKDEQSLRAAKQQARRAFYARSGIHDQFLPSHRMAKALTAVLAVGAAAALLIASGANTLRGYEHEQWTKLVQAAPSAVLCDKHLLDRYMQFGQKADLMKVGMLAACQEYYIGP